MRGKSLISSATLHGLIDRELFQTKRIKMKPSDDVFETPAICKRRHFECQNPPWTARNTWTLDIMGRSRVTGELTEREELNRGNFLIHYVH